jgi:hypothetical protein
MPNPGLLRRPAPTYPQGALCPLESRSDRRCRLQGSTMPEPRPQQAPTPPQTIVFDHIENRTTVMASDAAMRLLFQPQQATGTSGIPKQA